MFLIFVYGTLRKGLWNHTLFKNHPNGHTFIGNAKTDEKYTMYYNIIPFVSNTKETCQIIGEVYEVDEACLNDLDTLEGHPVYYTRELIKVTLENGDKVDAWLYFNNKPNNYPIEVTGDFLNTNIKYKKLLNKKKNDFRIFTSYFNLVDNVISKGLVPVSIASKTPDYAKDKVLFYPKLAPPWPLIKAYKTSTQPAPIKEHIYTEGYYTQVLNNLNPKTVYEELIALGKGSSIVLMCWEQSGLFCHRHLDANWLTNAIPNLEIPELVPKESYPNQTPLF